MHSTTHEHLHLDSEELGILGELLESEHTKLLIEIRHSHHRAFRDELRHRLDVLEQIAEHCGAAAGSAKEKE